jgi:hypothetical protein
MADAGVLAFAGTVPYEAPNMSRLTFACLLGVAALVAGCGGGGGPGPGSGGPTAGAPTIKAGDRWVYSGKDGYRVPVVWTETHSVTAAGPDGITVRVTVKGPTVDVERTETWSAPGVVTTGAVYDIETDRFDPALVRYRFPMSVGESWRQSLRDLNKPAGPYGPIRRTAEVQAYESVTTPAGTFDAFRIRVFMQLDDETFYRNPTQCNYLIWYAPAVGAMVREEKRSYYTLKSDEVGGAVPGQYATIELVSYARSP